MLFLYGMVKDKDHALYVSPPPVRVQEPGGLFLSLSSFFKALPAVNINKVSLYWLSKCTSLLF